jgi:hypothetical protein
LKGIKLDKISTGDLITLLDQIEKNKPKFLLYCNDEEKCTIEDLINGDIDFKRYKITIEGSKMIEQGKIFILPDDRKEKPIRVIFE